MKIILKTITGKQHEVVVEANATVLDVKKMLEEEYEPASLRLCFNGAVLEDSKLLTEAGVGVNDSLVLAGRKRKIPKPTVSLPAEPPMTEVVPESSAPASVVAPSISTSTPPLATASPASPAAATVPPAAAIPTAPVAPATSNAPAASTASLYGVAPNLIDEVASMGFEDRVQIALALRAAFMNVDRAVEYLFDGIPPHIVEEITRQSSTAAPAAAPGTSNQSAYPASAVAPVSTSSEWETVQRNAESEMRAALSRIPQFDEIRALYNQNTDTLPLVVQQIRLRHPSVYEQIERDPEVFLSIMGEAGQPGMTNATPRSVAPSTTQAVVGDAEGSSFMNQLQTQIELSAEDRTAVQQLVELGGGMWDEQSAVLVYLATQRNQEVAASILFEHGGVPEELLGDIAAQMVDEEVEGHEGEQ
ncbi:hypothetical protein JKF63_03122 [Porcisia hertigi]|uniref:UV excision repair protein RAD23 n=1 Tax=Porcisia hertigi TaxID=2761500 RepID=A0A836LFZ7_9TRYP|nr:hypothetical protein JKF63_03122 [Porcisia hertigi]